MRKLRIRLALQKPGTDVFSKWPILYRIVAIPQSPRRNRFAHEMPNPAFLVFGANEE
jgi:hypothetical protein